MSSERELTEKLWGIMLRARAILRLPLEEKEEAINLIKKGASVMGVVVKFVEHQENSQIAWSEGEEEDYVLEQSMITTQDRLKELTDLAKEAGYEKLSPNKTDQLLKMVEKRDEMNKEHLLDHKLPSDVTKKIMSMTKDKKGGKTLKKKPNKKGKKTQTKKSGVPVNDR